MVDTCAISWELMSKSAIPSEHVLSPLQYWATVVLLSVLTVLEFFDFFVVGFLTSVVGPEWRLSYEQTSIVLASSGVGWILGAIFWGVVADRYGRRPSLLIAAVACGLASGLVAFLSDGAWISFSLLRGFVGFCAVGSSVIAITLVVEMTPARRRAVLTTAFSVPAGAGVLVAALASSFLLPILGWRGLAACGFMPTAVAAIAFFVIPESAAWLAARIDGEDSGTKTARQPWTALWLRPSRFVLVVGSYFFICCAMYGVVQWGPTVVAMLEGRDAARAAQLFILVGAGGLVGRLAFVLLVHLFGRRRSGEIMGYGAALALASAATLYAKQIEGIHAFVPFIVLSAFFYDGGIANLHPYPAELYPPTLAARAMGLASTASGLAKIVGPVLVGFVASRHGETVTQSATVAAITPAFLLLALSAGLSGLIFSTLGVETSLRRR